MKIGSVPFTSGVLLLACMPAAAQVESTAGSSKTWVLTERERSAGQPSAIGRSDRGGTCLAQKLSRRDAPIR